LNKITDLKNAPKGRVQNIQLCKGRVKKKKVHGRKTKLTYITGGTDLFTLILIINLRPDEVKGVVRFEFTKLVENQSPDVVGDDEFMKNTHFVQK
jgi:hypothetical protein